MSPTPERNLNRPAARRALHGHLASMLFCLLAGLPVAQADTEPLQQLRASEPVARGSLRQARQLLRVTDTGTKFDRHARVSYRNIIRSYSIIVSRSLDISLPQGLKNQIARCYETTYSWQRYENGMAEILARNLSVAELDMLLGFYRSEGIAPYEIDSFRDTIAKADRITEQALTFVLAASDGCVEQDARLIRAFLDQQFAQSYELHN